MAKLVLAPLCLLAERDTGSLVSSWWPRLTQLQRLSRGLNPSLPRTRASASNLPCCQVGEMPGALPRLEGQLRAQGQTSPPMATALAGQSRAGLVSAGHCVDGPVGAFLTEQCDGTELWWREPSPNRSRRNTWGFRFPSSHTPSIPPAAQSKPGQQLLSGPTSESRCAWVIKMTRPSQCL